MIEIDAAYANAKKHADAFNSAKQKSVSDRGNAKNHYIQMRNELQASVDIYANYLAKFENKLQKIGTPKLDVTVDELNSEMAKMRKDVEANKKTIEQLDKIIKQNN